MIKAEDQTLKPTDLRIGNWINVYGIDDQATDIMCDSVNTKTYPCMTYENINGIELNEEWLIKLGFEKVASAWCLGTFTLGTKTNEKSTPYFTTSSFLIEILTVHQLQNLYHSLTGTELTTKP